MGSESVPLPLIAHQSGVNKGFTFKSLSERRVESELSWLIKVGLLRREVDGQGITDSFRLTPLGKQVVQEWKNSGDLPKPTWWERCQNQVRRWLSFSL
jgi:DNA-binding PadR family transcriptional regulator